MLSEYSDRIYMSILFYNKHLIMQIKLVSFQLHLFEPGYAAVEGARSWQQCRSTDQEDLGAALGGLVASFSGVPHSL